TLPQLQVAEAAAALGDGCVTVRLAAMLGVPEDDPDLTAALSRLTALALVWPLDGGLAAALTKLSSQDEDRTRLTIELLVSGGLAQLSEAGLTPSTRYDEFAGAEPADQLLEVLEEWLRLPASPLAPGDDARALYWDEEEELVLIGLRPLVLRTLRDTVPDGQTVECGVLATRLSWQSPVLADRAMKTWTGTSPASGGRRTGSACSPTGRCPNSAAVC
ncbi:MAG: hypothetical protein ABW022_02985, partial [Actinoplanes sp.]